MKTYKHSFSLLRKQIYHIADLKEVYYMFARTSQIHMNMSVGGGGGDKIGGDDDESVNINKHAEQPPLNYFRQKIKTNSKHKIHFVGLEVAIGKQSQWNDWKIVVFWHLTVSSAAPAIHRSVAWQTATTQMNHKTFMKSRKRNIKLIR